MLKIDAEGHELSVLKGLSKALKHDKIDIIHFEFNEMNVVSRIFFRDFYYILKDFTFYRMLRDGLVPIKQYNPLYHEIFAYQNIIAVRDGVNFKI